MHRHSTSREKIFHKKAKDKIQFLVIIINLFQDPTNSYEFKFYNDTKKVNFFFHLHVIYIYIYIYTFESGFIYQLWKPTVPNILTCRRIQNWESTPSHDDEGLSRRDHSEGVSRNKIRYEVVDR